MEPFRRPYQQNRHTTHRARRRARCQIRDYLAHRKFSLVLTSPMQRARETCRVAGYADVAQIDENLREWDYGVYEGRTTAEIRKQQPDWSIWDSPVLRRVSRSNT